MQYIKDVLGNSNNPTSPKSDKEAYNLLVLSASPKNWASVFKGILSN